MVALSRLLTYATLACLLVAVAAFVVGWFSRPDGPTLAAAESPGKGPREPQVTTELDARVAASRARLLARGRLAQELVDGKVTLAAAIKRFRSLQAEDTRFWQWLRLYEKGASDEERLGRNLIGRARGIVADEPRRARALTARLEAELQAVLKGEPGHAH